MDDQGNLQDVVVQFMGNPGPPNAPGGGGEDLLIGGGGGWDMVIGGRPDPGMNGFVALFFPGSEAGPEATPIALEIGW
jgi:hypothetical protein